MSGKILFVDLDGTVRLGASERGGKFVNGPEDVELFPGVYELLRDYKARGWHIVAISNQGGIAMGLVSESQVSRAMQETSRLTGNIFDRILWCSHHPDAKDEDERDQRSKSQCMCRKPMPGLVYAAVMSLSEQWATVFHPWDMLFVGDRPEDEQCAKNCGVPFMWAEDWRKEPIPA